MTAFALFISYIFLYAPLIIIIIFSFNSSLLPGEWTGFSFKWYIKLFNNNEMISAFLTSLKVAILSAFLAVIIGSVTAFVTTKIKSVKNYAILSSFISTPLVIPEVITGVSLLLTFISLGQYFHLFHERGILTLTIGHTTVGIAYTYWIIRSRLIDFNKSVEEAAADLGAHPLKVFITITIPIIAPSLLSSWLLSFVISIDDVVLASFLSGPGATTLPLLIFSNLRLGITPEINALATLIIVNIIVVMFIFVSCRKYNLHLYLPFRESPSSRI
ncbi:MAG: ABC transporter permease subunit [Alphaproteobacteria bacterium]